MREPLRKIHTFSDWLMEQEAPNLSEKGKNLVEKVNASVHRMEALIEDILVLTKIHSDTRKEKEVNLNSVIKEVFDDMFEQIVLTQTEVQVDALPVIKGNLNQMYYLIKNLVSNAIKFQKPGNVPKIRITSEIINGEEIGISNAYDEYVKISFIDNGFGLDKKYSKKIFQVFQRLHGKQEFEGTGIGLAVCKKIMENHNGIITVESELGKGSVFSCYFPLH
jgi:light-regulated signal transduction histidine kinase (bacteriophytochrome)